MDRLEAMTILLEALDAGSLSAAGRRLRMPLATVSRKISDLEGHLGTRLLMRGNRQLTLTEAGRNYVAACRKILEDVSEAERVASGEYRAPRGELAISASILFGRLHVLPVVGDFLKAYPDIHVRLLQTDRVVNLLQEHIDLAVRLSELPDSSLVATRVGMIQRVAVASPAYLAERGTPEAPEDLGRHDCITFDTIGSGNSWDFGRGKQHSSVPVRSRLTVSTAESAVDAALAGLGIARVLSYQIEKELESGTLVQVLTGYQPAATPVSLVYPSQQLLPLKLRAFLDFAAPRLRARLPQAPGR